MRHNSRKERKADDLMQEITRVLDEHLEDQHNRQHSIESNPGRFLHPRHNTLSVSPASLELKNKKRS